MAEDAFLRKSHWRLDEIAAQDPARSEALENAEAPQNLVNSLADTLRCALKSGEGVLIGRESNQKNQENFRLVLQLCIGTKLYDWFFNARTGYRAQFCLHYKCGLRFNNLIIDAVRSILCCDARNYFCGYDLIEDFAQRRDMQIPKDFVVTSLSPYYSKVWSCDNRIGVGEKTPLPCYSGPKLLVRDGKWTALHHYNDDDAWLDIKGAFIGNLRLYQTRPPFERARDLQESGTA